MKKRGFSLIEVMVAVAVVSILAGLMIPAAWRWWEIQEVETTKERMNALKIAMTGDRSLIQNGIRTSYGFVGDVGELPFGNATTHGGLKYLIANPAPTYPNWNGPYLSGYDPATYSVDAWGRRFIYTLSSNQEGYGNRHLSGEIRSAGADGIPGNADDIVMELNSKEVAPTARMQGNFTNLDASNKSALIEVRYRDPLQLPSGEITGQMCTPIFPNYTTIIRDVGVPMRLPVGKVSISAKIHNDTTCSQYAGRTSSLDFFVSDNISSLLVNLPTTPSP